jgi:hypothetical protein
MLYGRESEKPDHLFVETFQYAAIPLSGQPNGPGVYGDAYPDGFLVGGFYGDIK